MDPFSPDYHQAALELHLSLRGRPDGGYVSQRDETSSAPVPENFWSQLLPFGLPRPRDVEHPPLRVEPHHAASGHVTGGSVQPLRRYFQLLQQ